MVPHSQRGLYSTHPRINSHHTTIVNLLVSQQPEKQTQQTQIQKTSFIVYQGGNKGTQSQQHVRKLK